MPIYLKLYIKVHNHFMYCKIKCAHSDDKLLLLDVNFPFLLSGLVFAFVILFDI